MAIAIGTQAPEFSLKSKKGDEVTDLSLSNNLGKRNTVLLFFPLAFTGVCTTEMCEVSAGLRQYEALDAEVIGISVDSPFAQEAWAKQENIDIPLASDLNKKAAQDYGVLLDDLMGFGAVSARAAFVIDKSGIVRYAEQTPTPKELPNFEIIRSTLQGLQ